MSSPSTNDGLRWKVKRGILQTKSAMRKSVKRVFRTVGYDIVPYGDERKYPVDFTPEHVAIIEKVRPYTLTPVERIYAMIEAVRYVELRKIPGAIVECGVWRGGSMMTAALVLNSLKSDQRDLYLFDTFQGMPKPDAVDVDFDGIAAMKTFTEQQTGDDTSTSCFATLSDVQATMALSGYNSKRVHFIQGKVEDTIPLHSPQSIALLRLDTDWYASTRHEFEHLYPLLAPGGVLIVDDYGHWQGARKATDEYLEAHAPDLFLNRIDFSARLAVK